ncbi:small-conductance mechanosensitive channel MscS [Dokdonella soli]|uniref:Small-conductance mechanosensitive channel n=2 Tax=Dokdonella soli TaxID=529810 RepID=A0ABN1IKB0_9GAMM
MVFAWSGRLLIALLILLVGWWLARRVAMAVQRVLARAGADPLLGHFLYNLVLVLLLAVVVTGALDRIGVPTASLLAALGAAGLAIGLALQGSLSHLAAGVLLMVFRPFRVGQYVEIAGVGGTVQDVSLMHTRLLTPDNREVVLPNGKVAGDAIVNYSARGTRRLDLVVGIGYGDDIGKAIAVVRELLGAEPRVLADPPADVAVMQLADSSVNLAIRPWVKSGEYWSVQTTLLRAIKERFDAQGISIPVPRREVVLHVARDASALANGASNPSPPKPSP